MVRKNTKLVERISVGACGWIAGSGGQGLGKRVASGHEGGVGMNGGHTRECYM
jgi:hypothetical protein